jgi:hypothetical protein
MAIYPDDAVVPTTAYSTLTGGINASVSITTSLGPYTLPTAVSFAGQVVITNNSTGLLVPVSSYYLTTAAGTTITFNSGSNPGTGTYTFRCVDLPATYRVISTSPTLSVSAVRYSSSSVTVEGNAYVTNGSTRTFSLPESALGTVNNGNFLLVSNAGLVVNTSAYAYPGTGTNYNTITFGTAPSAGAIVEIRATSTTRQYTTRLTDMRYRKPSNGYTTQNQFNVSKYSTQAGYEKRRLLSRRPKRNFQLSYNVISGVERQAIENFYSARNGEYEAFTFDLTHINQTGTVNCRFNGPIDIQQIISKGSSLTENFYNIKFNLQEDF